MRARKTIIVATLVIVPICHLVTPGEASDPESAFKARCSDCHSNRDIQRWARQYPDAPARTAWLDRSLRRHHAENEAERALIMLHIEAVIAAGTRPR